MLPVQDARLWRQMLTLKVAVKSPSPGQPMKSRELASFCYGLSST